MILGGNGLGNFGLGDCSGVVDDDGVGRIDLDGTSGDAENQNCGNGGRNTSERPPYRGRPPAEQPGKQPAAGRSGSHNPSGADGISPGSLSTSSGSLLSANSAGGLECLANILAAHALPYHGIAYGFSRNLVPDYDGLALVSEGDREPALLASALLHHIADHLDGMAVENLGIVFDPSLAGVDLVVSKC